MATTTFLKALANVSPFVEFLTGLYDTGRADQATGEVNRMADEGRATIDQTGTRVRDRSLDLADWLWRSNQDTTSEAYTRSSQNVGQFAQNYFGMGTPTEQSAPPPATSPSYRDTLPDPSKSVYTGGQIDVQVIYNQALQRGLSHEEALDATWAAFDQWESRGLTDQGFSPEEVAEYQRHRRRNALEGDARSERAAVHDESLATLDQIRLGEGGASGALRDEGRTWLGDLASRETTRHGEVASRVDALGATLTNEFTALKDQLGREFTDIISRSEAAIEATRTDMAALLAEAHTAKADALGEIMDDAAYHVASVSASLSSDLSAAKSQLQAKYAGRLDDPGTRAMYHAELQALEQSYRGNIMTTTAETQGTYTKFKAEVATQQDAILGNLSAALEQTLGNVRTAAGETIASAYQTATSTLERAMSTWATGMTDLETVRAQSGEVMSTLLSQAEGEVFNAWSKALLYDADVVRNLYNAVTTLDTNAATAQAATDATYVNQANAAWAGWGNFQVAEAEALLNATIEMVNWSDPIGAFGDNITSLWQTEEDIQAQEDARDAAETASWVNLGTSVATGGLSALGQGLR